MDGIIRKRLVRRLLPLAALFAAPVALAGCATHPLGPSVMVMPAPNKPFEVFAQDQALCRSFADQQVNGGAAAANNQAVGSAIVGTALGAGLGAAIGGSGGAAIGAASGAFLGTGVGANNSSYAGFDLQQRYDMAYMQCMYARGNQVPGFSQPVAAYYAPPPPPNELPPPNMPARHRQSVSRRNSALSYQSSKVDAPRTQPLRDRRNQPLPDAFSPTTTPTR